MRWILLVATGMATCDLFAQRAVNDPWGLFPPCRTAGLCTTAEIARLAIPATVTIENFDARGNRLGQGSGFLLLRASDVVTNWHVIANASRAVVTFPDGEQVTNVLAIGGDSSADIAVLRIAPRRRSALLSRTNRIDVGERIVVIGTPLGLSSTVSEGIVSAHRSVNGRSLLQITAPISSGSSGGAVLDESGRVIAVATAFMKSGQQLNFAVPITSVVKLMSSASAPRALVAVFGDQRQSRPETDVALREGTVINSSPRAAPAGIPGSLSGSFRVDQRWTSLDGTEEYYDVGELFLGRVGGAARLRRRFGNTRPSPLFASATLRDADTFELRLADATYRAARTEKGFRATSRMRLDDGRTFDLSLTATSVAWNRADDSGLYSVQLNTVLEDRVGIDPTPVAWSGIAALVITGDSVTMDVELANESGGSVSLRDRVQITPMGDFYAVDESGTVSLRGQLRAGKLRGTWVDVRVREAVRFNGSLTGRRY